MSETNENCLVCIHARALADENNVLCEKKGLVPNNYRCHRQQTDLTKINIRRKRTAAPLPALKKQ